MKIVKIVIFSTLFLAMLCLFFIGWWKLGAVKVSEENDGYNYEFFVKDQSSFKFFFFYPEGEEDRRRLSDEDFRAQMEYCENDSSNWRCGEPYKQERARREGLKK